MKGHRCYYPEISTERCNASFSDCEANRKSGVCRVDFVVKTTARERARSAYCHSIGKSPDTDLHCTSNECVGYCGECEEFMSNYDDLTIDK